MNKKQEEKEILEDEESKVYEVGFHVVPTVVEEDVFIVANEVKNSVEASKGQVVADGNPIMINLAYTMDHIVANKKSMYDRAYFGWVKFQSDVEGMLKVKDALEKNEKIFRFLIIKTVRESTLMRKQVVRSMKKTTTFTKSGLSTNAVVKKEPKVEISEEEVDKAIEELVVE